MLEKNKGDIVKRPPLIDIKYPEIQRDNKQSDKIWNETIYDPYKNIENDLDKMMKLQTNIMGICIPDKQITGAVDVLKKLYCFERQSCPRHYGKCRKLFYYYNDGNMENDVIMMEDLDNYDKVLVESSNKYIEYSSNYEPQPTSGSSLEFWHKYHNVNKKNRGEINTVSGDELPIVGHSKHKVDDNNEDNDKDKTSESNLSNDNDYRGKRQIIVNVNSVNCLIKLFVVSPDCDLIAYVTKNLNDDDTHSYHLENIYCYMVSRKTVLDEYIKNVHYTSIAWTKDSMGFFYAKNTNENYDSTPEIYYHWTVFGMKGDVLIGKFPQQKFWKLHLNVTENGRYLLVTVTSDKRGNFLYFAKIPKDGLLDGLLKFYQIVNKWKRTYKYITSCGSNLVFLTDRYALKRCLIQFTLHTSVPKCHCNWKKLIPETNELLVDAVVIRKNVYFCHYLNEFGLSFCTIYKANCVEFENIKTINLNNLYITEITTNGDGLVYYKSESYDTPPIITRLEFKEDKKKPKLTKLCENRPKGYPIKGKFLFDSFVDKSNDARLIFTTFDDENNQQLENETQTNNKKNKSKFCYLIVNGGFGELNVPKYDPFIFYLLIKYKACITRALIPGGGEFGRLWHNKGKLRKKVETIKIMSNILEKLKGNYTNIILYGCHNGGLIGAISSILFSNYLSGIIAVEPVTDLFHINDYGCDALIKEYGSVEHCHNDFEAIKLYSPYYLATINGNFKDSIIPPILMQCSSEELIFHYRHSVKMTAQLQYALTKGVVKGNGPVVLCSYNIPEYELKSFRDLIKRYADRLVFIKNVILNNPKRGFESWKI